MVKLQSKQHNFHAYIPETLLIWHRDSGASEPHRVSRLEGTLLCVDASGFTAMTRKLSEQGRLGSELLTSRLNVFFEEMSRPVFERGGDVLKFAGDAFWAFFPDNFAPGNFLRDALDSLKNVNTADKLAREYPLTIHMGAESGEFWLASLGNPAVRLEAEPTGALVQDVYRMCDVAETNQLVLGPSLAEECVKNERLTPLSDGAFLVEPSAASLTKPGSLHFPTISYVISEEMLRPYLPLEVAERLQTSDSGASLQSEHREVVVLFANFEHQSDNSDSGQMEIIEELNNKLSVAFGIIKELGGSISRIDPYASGHKLLVLFGAPVKQEADELKSVACAGKLSQLQSERFRIRVGLSRGPLFCGDVGAVRRREYTVMGDAANMAARLMSKAAWGRVLLDQSLRNALPEHIKTSMIELPLKGIGDRVPCYELSGVTDELHDSTLQAGIIGLTEESHRLRNLWEEVCSGTRKIVIVDGGAGVGKTILVKQFRGHVGEKRSCHYSGLNTVLHHHGWLAGKALADLYARFNPGGANGLIEHIKETVGPEWFPLFARVLDLEEEDNSWTKGLSGDLRLTKTKQLLSNIVDSLVHEPVALIIDDCDSADEYSLSLFAGLHTAKPALPLMLILVCRDSQSLAQFSENYDETITVSPPGDDEWSNFFTQQFSDGKREEEFCSKLLSVSDKNPHLITDFIKSCVDKGSLVRHPLSGQWSVEDSGSEFEYPRSLQDVHLARFDRLPEGDRDLLKAASVISGVFSAELLSELIHQEDSGWIENRLAKLTKVGFLRNAEIETQFEFGTTSMREAVYACIPEERTVEFHRKFASFLSEKPGVQPDVLAYHYGNANVAKESFHWALQAAMNASRVNSLTENAKFLRQCQNTLQDSDPPELGLDNVFVFYREFASSLTLEGRYAESYRVYRNWRRLGAIHTRERESVRAALETAQTLWRQSRYTRSRQITSSLLASDALAENTREYAIACLVMADLERRSGNFTGAKNWCEKSIERTRHEEDKEDLADGYNKLGLSLWGGGELEQASKSFHKSLKFGEKYQGKYAQARTINNLGIISHALGKYVESEKRLGQALEIFKNIGDIRSQSYACGNLANVSRIIGKFTRARELFQQADLIFQKLGDAHAHHYTVGNIGDIDLIEGDWESAEGQFTEALTFAESVGDRELAAECHVRFGELAFFTDNVERAEGKYRRAIEEAQAIGSKEWFIRAAIGLARLYIGERQDTKALELIEKILFSASESKASISANEAVFLSGEYYRITDRKEEAARRYQSAMRYAVANGVFELALKSSVRLYETLPDKKQESFAALAKTIKKYISENNLQQWNTIARSGYFSYFSTGLIQALRDNQRDEWMNFTNKL